MALFRTEHRQPVGLPMTPGRQVTHPCCFGNVTGMALVSRASPMQTELHNSTGDNGGPSGSATQQLAAIWDGLPDRVVETSGRRSRQARRERRAQANRCRSLEKLFRQCQNRGGTCPARGTSDSAPSGIRRVGAVLEQLGPERENLSGDAKGKGSPSVRATQHWLMNICRSAWQWAHSISWPRQQTLLLIHPQIFFEHGLRVHHIMEAGLHDFDGR